MKIKKGDLLAFTTGEYSDYCLRGTVRALKDFDQRETVLAFVALHPFLEERTRYKSKEVVGYCAPNYDFTPTEEFIAWLNKEGFVEDCNVVQEWWLGGYRDISLPKCETT